jgi:hypothetical protein
MREVMVVWVLLGALDGDLIRATVGDRYYKTLVVGKDSGIFVRFDAADGRVVLRLLEEEVLDEEGEVVCVHGAMIG